MGEESDFSGPQFRANRPEAVRTTIVGGRPPGGGRDLGPIPRGIEVLVKKAAVDPDFRELLLTDSDEACRSIELELEPIEAAMLQAVGREQLIAVIDRTRVPEEHRRAFLGKTAAAMIAILSGTAGLAEAGKVFGGSGGIRMERPSEPKPPPSNLDRIAKILATHTEVASSKITADSKLVDNLNLDIDAFQSIRAEIKKSFGVLIPVEDHNRPFKHYPTVGDLVAEVALKTDDGRKVVKILAKQFRVEPKTITAKTRFVEDLKASRSSMASIRTRLTQTFRVALPAKDISNAKTVLELVDIVVAAREKQAASQQLSRGVRPDIPPGTKGTGGTFGLRP